jgi:hypothetical protein
MRSWYGISKRIGKRTWLNFTKSGPSITESLGHGSRLNWSPKYGLSYRYSRRLCRGGSGCLGLILLVAGLMWLAAHVRPVG